MDRTRWPELLVGLAEVRVLDVARDVGRVRVVVETTGDRPDCGGCGGRAWFKDRSKVELADLPAFGTPVTLVWDKRRFTCPGPGCAVGSWSEHRPDIAGARATMTTRAGRWATVQVGRHCHTVSWAAAELGVTWHTVMDAIGVHGGVLVDDPDRIGTTEAIGVDETSFLSATPSSSTRWVSSICDVKVPKVLDVIEGRQAPDLDTWLSNQDECGRPGWPSRWRTFTSRSGPR